MPAEKIAVKDVWRDPGGAVTSITMSCLDADGILWKITMGPHPRDPKKMLVVRKSSDGRSSYLARPLFMQFSRTAWAVVRGGERAINQSKLGTRQVAKP